MARGSLASLAVVGVLLAIPPSRSLADVVPEGALRRPVAVALADQGKWLFVANQSGSINVIDAASLKIVREVRAGRKISDLAITPDGNLLLAVDEEAGELVVFRRLDSRLETRRRVNVGPFPVSVRILADGTRCVVASLWARQLTVVELLPDPVADPRVLKTIHLAFAPRLSLVIPESNRIIVADAFGGHLAVVEASRGELESDRLLPAHNIRGLALSVDGTRLLVSHQVLSSQATTSRDDIHWGNLIANGLRELRLTSVLDPKADLLRESRFQRLGDVGRGAGDPAGVAVSRDGKIAVALSGVDEVAIGGVHGGDWLRVAVGRRPTALVLSPDGQTAYVANTLGDSVSVLDLKTNRVRAEVALSVQPKLTAAQRGELLFYDARASHDGWFSCHSCHTDGHTSGLLADTLGDGSYGTPKRILTLLGASDTGPWAWNGGLRELEEQVRKSVETTMQGKKLTTAQENELTAYLRTLAPAPPLGPLRKNHDKEVVRRGRGVFEHEGCAGCHVPPSYTSPKAYDVGLADDASNRTFNPPSLRGVSQGGPYFHDGRAAALKEVFTQHRHQLQAELAREKLDELLTYLESL